MKVFAMKKFDQDLAALGARVMEMGTVAQSMVDMARLAMTELKSVYDKVLGAEDKLDKMQLDIDHEAVRVLTVYSPVASDLRYVLSVSHVNAALERIGDQAVGLCHTLDSADRQADSAVLPTLIAMGERAAVMVKDAMLAFFKRDADLAKAIMSKDDSLDELNDQVLKQTLSDDENSRRRDVATALTQILVARTWERIGDQATNICEEVIYIVQGADVRHAGKTKPLKISR
ncbi:MAG TPA: phosphate signaling complex protein PhoU [Tepidisphaeraceae bacterium]|nr:phosphate signaling complex protein PhoU [Tepidisphaeraceae bacterium]